MLLYRRGKKHHSYILDLNKSKRKYKCHAFSSQSEGILSNLKLVGVKQLTYIIHIPGQIVIWMMNDIDMDSEWALCFEFLTQSRDGEVAILSNDWSGLPFSYKITHRPAKGVIVGYFRLKDGTVAELVILGVVRVVILHTKHIV